MLIEIHGLTKKYGRIVAVDDLHLRIEHGEMLALLGPSGCGKTTTMRSIVGLETPTAGRISIGGETVYDATQGIDVSPNKREMGMVFQSYAIWPHMTVFENVAFPLKQRRISRPKITERVNKTLDLVGLQEMANRGASYLSGGQMQRVAFARSIVAEPKVLLLDEPLSNLDAKLRESLRFELREIQQRLDITAIYVTHDQHEALALADRIAVMNSGRIVQLDTPERLYRQPETKFVADFLGFSNIFPCKILEPGKGSEQTVRLDGTDIVIMAQGRAPDRKGDGAHICIRPEHLIVRKKTAPPSPTADETGKDTNVLPARVLVSSFLGDHTRYLLESSPGLRFDAIARSQEGALPRGTDVEILAAAQNVQIVAGG